MSAGSKEKMTVEEAPFLVYLGRKNEERTIFGLGSTACHKSDTKPNPPQLLVHARSRDKWRAQISMTDVQTLSQPLRNPKEILSLINAF